MDEVNIGALARFMGVSVHTIKYYEKIGLFAPSRDENSNYRRYQPQICTALTECIKYRSMGFSLKELDVLRKSADGQLQLDMMQKRIATIDREIENLQWLRRVVGMYERECQRCETELGEWYIEPYDLVTYCRKQTDNLQYTEAYLSEDAINMMDYAPQTLALLVIDKDYVNDRGPQHFSWGQSVSFKEPHPGFEKVPQFIRLAPKKAFVTYRKYTGHFVTDGSIKTDIRNVFHEYKQEIPEDVYAFGIKIVHDEDGNDWNYMKIVIPL